jgi:hypothetical protein
VLLQSLGPEALPPQGFDVVSNIKPIGLEGIFTPGQEESPESGHLGSVDPDDWLPQPPGPAVCGKGVKHIDSRPQLRVREPGQRAQVFFSA